MGHFSARTVIRIKAKKLGVLELDLPCVTELNTIFVCPGVPIYKRAQIHETGSSFLAHSLLGKMSS